jgi:hypothetical protein
MKTNSNIKGGVQQLKQNVKSCKEKGGIDTLTILNPMHTEPKPKHIR